MIVRSEELEKALRLRKYDENLVIRCVFEEETFDLAEMAYQAANERLKYEFEKRLLIAVGLYEELLPHR